MKSKNTPLQNSLVALALLCILGGICLHFYEVKNKTVDQVGNGTGSQPATGAVDKTDNGTGSHQGNETGGQQGGEVGGRQGGASGSSGNGSVSGGSRSGNGYGNGLVRKVGNSKDESGNPKPKNGKEPKLPEPGEDDIDEIKTHIINNQNTSNKYGKTLKPSNQKKEQKEPKLPEPDEGDDD